MVRLDDSLLWIWWLNLLKAKQEKLPKVDRELETNTFQRQRYSQYQLGYPLSLIAAWLFVCLSNSRYNDAVKVL